jgi:hypothetical protein
MKPVTVLKAADLLVNTESGRPPKQTVTLEVKDVTPPKQMVYVEFRRLPDRLKFKKN